MKSPTPILDIESMTYGGAALARHEGKVIFVRGAMPGERVRVVIEEDRGRFAVGRAIEVVVASSDRVDPRCRHAGSSPDACGGCQWQHIDYPAQLRFKTELVVEQLERLGGFQDPPVESIIPSPEPWQYRHHVQLSVDPEGALGFKASRSDRIVPIVECPISQPALVQWLHSPDHSPEPGDRIEVRQGSEQPAPLQVWRTPRRGQSPSGAPVHFRLHDRTFQVSPGSFFQVNRHLVETLVDRVVEQLDVQLGERVLDGYCGVGLFSAFLAEKAGHLIAIESNEIAVADARVNLTDLRVELRTGRLERELARIRGPLDAVVVDPPRAGCAKALAPLIEREPERIVSVSCDPSTFARDARCLVDAGYELVRVQPIDLFPQTYHIETISLLRRR